VNFAVVAVVVEIVLVWKNPSNLTRVDTDPNFANLDNIVDRGNKLSYGRGGWRIKLDTVKREDGRKDLNISEGERNRKTGR